MGWWWPVAITALIAEAADAYAAAPIYWVGPSARNLVLSPSVLSERAVFARGFSMMPQKLALMDPSGWVTRGAIPRFIRKSDETIAWENTDLCIEADGNNLGDAVRVNQCNGEAMQLWWLWPSHGRTSHLQLKGSHLCMSVSEDTGSDEFGGVGDGAPVKLQECGTEEKQLLMFDEHISMARQGSLESSARSFSARHLFACFTSLVMLAALTVTLWIQQGRERKEAPAVTSKLNETSHTDMDGVCLSEPVTADRDLDRCPDPWSVMWPRASTGAQWCRLDPALQHNGGPVSRRAMLQSTVAACTALPLTWPTNAVAAEAPEPSEAAVSAARQAFQAFDRKDLSGAETLFSQAIEEWRKLDRGNRGIQERTTLLVARASVRTDRKDFAAAKLDLDEAIGLMAPTGEKPSGIAAYREYPDAFVQRGLVQEGLRNWSAASSDYDKAISLWGGTGDGVNPFALSYRGRARSELGDYEGALADFRDSSSIFYRIDKNNNQAGAARANEAITLYAMGRRDEAVRIAKQVITRTPGFTDLHVLLAADAWDRGDRQGATYHWDFACYDISTGCRNYRDVDGWLTEVRRWPHVLVEKQRAFLERRSPQAVQNNM